MNHRGDTTCNRDTWEFEYSGKALAEAAMAKRDHHQSRVDVWQQEQNKLMAEVRESGLEINEDMSYGLGSSTTRAPHVAVKDNLQSKLRECHAKIREHRDSMREYDGWVQVLRANMEARLRLKYDDWLFYFGTN